MKTKKLKGLKLNKELITNLDAKKVRGGHGCPTNYCTNTLYGGGTLCEY